MERAAWHAQISVEVQVIPRCELFEDRGRVRPDFRDEQPQTWLAPGTYLEQLAAWRPRAAVLVMATSLSTNVRPVPFRFSFTGLRWASSRCNLLSLESAVAREQCRLLVVWSLRSLSPTTASQNNQTRSAIRSQPLKTRSPRLRPAIIHVVGSATLLHRNQYPVTIFIHSGVNPAGLIANRPLVCQLVGSSSKQRDELLHPSAQTEPDLSNHGGLHLLGRDQR